MRRRAFRAKRSRSSPRGVLEGVRVLDLGRFISAPYCAMLLADMGAEVIRIERPGGEEDRTVGLTVANGENLTYPNLARNKKAITLDLRHRSGRHVLADLVARTDVLVHNFSREAAAAMRITYDELRVTNPRLIYTSISCYGTVGPAANRTGFDPIAQTASGALALTGFEGDVPLRCGVPWVDYSTGLAAALGTVLALRQRDTLGTGQAVDCALLQTAIGFVAPMIGEAVIGGRSRPRLGNRAAYLGPSDLYSCCDGFVYIACATETAWHAVMRLIGRPDLAEAPELRTHMARFNQRERIDGLVSSWMAQRSVSDAVAALSAARIPCGVYNTLSQVTSDPQVIAARMLHDLDVGLPKGEAVPVAPSPFRLSASREVCVRRPPRVGEHNGEIYRRLLGYDRSRLATMVKQGIV